jgi:hypothetical protein
VLHDNHFIGKFRTGFDSQQADGPSNPDRPNNLWEALPGDHGARGEFTERAHDRSLQWWSTTHRSAIVGGASAAALVAGGCGANVAKARIPTGLRALGKTLTDRVGDRFGSVFLDVVGRVVQLDDLVIRERGTGFR